MQIRLETLLLSINTINIKNDILSTLKNSNILDESDKKLIEEYELLCENLGDIPKPSILVDSNPIYINVPIINNDESLLDYTRLFINNKKKLKVAQELSSSAAKLMNNEDAKQISDEVINILSKLGTNSDEEFKITTIADSIDIYNKKDTSNKYKTGLRPIDEKTGGISEGSVTIILGGTGSFKTMTTTNICYSALNQKRNVAYMSFEVSKDNLYFSLISRHSVSGRFKHGLEYQKIRNKELRDIDIALFNEIASDLNSDKFGKISIIDENDIEDYNIASFRSTLKKVDNYFVNETGKGIDILVVDHAQLLKFNGDNKIDDPYVVINYFVSWFRQQSISFLDTGRKISVIIVSQASRKGMEYADRNNGEFLLTQLAEANELERSASYVISVYANEDLRSSKQLQVQLIKSRNTELMLDPEVISIQPEYYKITDSIIEEVKPVFESNITNINNIGGLEL